VKSDEKRKRPRRRTVSVQRSVLSPSPPRSSCGAPVRPGWVWSGGLRGAGPN